MSVASEPLEVRRPENSCGSNYGPGAMWEPLSFLIWFSVSRLSGGSPPCSTNTKAKYLGVLDGFRWFCMVLGGSWMVLGSFRVILGGISKTWLLHCPLTWKQQHIFSVWSYDRLFPPMRWLTKALHPSAAAPLPLGSHIHFFGDTDETVVSLSLSASF